MSATLTLLTEAATASGPASEQVQAAIFDCDGLLFDSESVWLAMLADFHARHGMAGADLAPLTGLVSDTAAEAVLARLVDAGHPRAAGSHSRLRCELQAELDADYSERIAAGVPQMPGAAELIAALAARVPVAVASNGRRADVRMMLAASGLAEHITRVCTVEDVAAGKPAPDLYFAAARALGVDPAACIAFEDSPVGSEAATAAGMVVTGVNPDTGIELACRHRLTSLQQVRVSGVPADITHHGAVQET